MFNQDFKTKGNQDQSAHYFSIAIESWAGLLAQQDAQHGGHKGNYADDQGCKQDFIKQGGKTKTNSQCINTGGKGQHQNDPDEQWIFYFPVFSVHKAFGNHFSSDKRQQSKGKPVIHRFDKRFHAVADHPAKQWHQSLEQGQEEGNLGRLVKTDVR